MYPEPRPHHITNRGVPVRKRQLSSGRIDHEIVEIGGINARVRNTLKDSQERGAKGKNLRVRLNAM